MPNRHVLVLLFIVVALFSLFAAGTAGEDQTAENSGTVTIMRVARPTDNLDQISRMYTKGLGFSVIGKFEDHDGFDGVILGHPKYPYHLEFTHHRGTKVGEAPTKDNIIAFYIPAKELWEKACKRMKAAGFKVVKSYNPYWDVHGKTFEDIDKYRVVLQNRAWTL